jgi:WD40 repeat protein
MLQPSLLKGGKSCLGSIGPWKEMAVPSAVTILEFGRTPAKDAFLLAAATQSGVIAVYRLAHTALERRANGVSDDMGSSPQKVWEWKGHEKAITFMTFVHDDEHLVSTSSDCSVKVWNVKDGRLLHELLDSALVISALALKKPAWAYVIANTNGVLRVVVDGTMQQKVRLDSYARSLAISTDGRRLLAGSSSGFIYGFSISETGKLEQSNQMQLTRNAITCLLVVDSRDGSPPLLIANSMDSTLCVLQGNKDLTNFTVQKRIPNQHKMLPLRSCHIPYPGTSGLVATGTEDGVMRAYNLDDFTEHRLEAHGVPVVDLAVTPGESTIMASGDVRGKIFLWRRLP